METVEQRHRDAAADLLHEISSLLDHNGIGQVADLIRDGEYDEHEATQAFARFEASLPPSAPDRDADKYRLMLLDLLAVIHRDGGHKTQEIGITLAHEQALQISSERIAALALPPSGIAEAVRERCAKVAQSLAQAVEDKRPDGVLNYTSAAAWSLVADAARDIEDAIRALDLSNMGDGE